MKILRILAAWLLLCGPVLAQAQIGSGQVWGNSTAARAPGKSETVTAILDRALGSTRGAVLERGASGWAIVGPGATVGLPWVSNGAGADPAYQRLGLVGGGTNADLSATGGASQFLRQNTAGGAISVIRPVCADLSNAAASCATDATNASNIGSGNLNILRFPSIAANTMISNWTAAGAVPLANTIPACANDGAHGLVYINGTGLQCATLTGVAFANPTATASDTAVNGVATTAMRSDSAPAVQKATNSQFGVMEPDGITLTCTTGVCGQKASTVTNSLGADVAMNNTANYFDGPSTAQGTSGIWLATGGVTVTDTAGTAAIFCKLWDGTTVIDSRAANTNGTTFLVAISLSGVLATPAANIRISCRDLTSTSGLIKFNSSSNAKDSTLTVYRVQ